MYLFKTQLIAAGWTVPASSDGTTYNASGDQITSGASGASGLGNNSAWFRIQDPDSLREYTIQRGTTDLVWRVKYSASAKFTTGSPSATQTPQSTDQQLIRGLGGGTDASPTFGQLFSTNATYRFHCMSRDAGNYGAYLLAYPNGGWSSGIGLSVLVFDPVLAAPEEDIDPYVHYTGLALDSAPLGVSHLGSNSTGAQGYMKKGLSGEGFVIIPGNNLEAVGVDTYPHGLVSNPHNSKDDEMPVPYARQAAQAAPTGWKGVSTMINWRGVSRSTGSTVSVNAAKDRIVVNSCSLPWDGSSDPLL